MLNPTATNSNSGSRPEMFVSLRELEIVSPGGSPSGDALPANPPAGRSGVVVNPGGSLPVNPLAVRSQFPQPIAFEYFRGEVKQKLTINPDWRYTFSSFEVYEVWLRLSVEKRLFYSREAIEASERNVVRFGGSSAFDGPLTQEELKLFGTNLENLIKAAKFRGEVRDGDKVKGEKVAVGRETVEKEGHGEAVYDDFFDSELYEKVALEDGTQDQAYST